MRILLTTMAENTEDANVMDDLAGLLAEVGHEASVFVAPLEMGADDPRAFETLKSELKKTIDKTKPDVIECHGSNNIAKALNELGYAYIMNFTKNQKTFLLSNDEIKAIQRAAVSHASFIFLENEDQRTVLKNELSVEDEKLVTLPFLNDEMQLLERLAYYQQMLVRHSLH